RVSGPGQTPSPPRDAGKEPAGGGGALGLPPPPPAASWRSTRIPAASTSSDFGPSTTPAPSCHRCRYAADTRAGVAASPAGAADIAGNRHLGRIGCLIGAAHLAMLARMAMLPPDGKERVA